MAVDIRRVVEALAAPTNVPKPPAKPALFQRAVPGGKQPDAIQRRLGVGTPTSVVRNADAPRKMAGVAMGPKSPSLPASNPTRVATPRSPNKY